MIDVIVVLTTIGKMKIINYICNLKFNDMRKYVTCRKEIDRTSNIASVRDHDPNFYVNDISRAAKLGKDLPKVSVSYGNDMLFNSPS